jgi:hypothetical protein
MLILLEQSAEALAVSRRGLEAALLAYGPEHVRIAELAYVQVRALEGADPLAEKALCRRAVAIFKIADETHGFFPEVLEMLAVRLMGSQEDYAECVASLELALAIRKRTLGEKHPSVAHVLHNFAGARASAGDFAEGVALAQLSYDIYYEANGEEHESTQSSRLLLERIRDAMPVPVITSTGWGTRVDSPGAQFEQSATCHACYETYTFINTNAPDGFTCEKCGGTGFSTFVTM